MKFIALADLHFSLYSNDKIDQNTGLSKRLSDIIRTFTYSLDYATENGIKNIVVMGDIYHTKSIIHSQVENILISLFRNYKNLNFILLSGNHDVSSQSGTGVTALKGLERDNVKVIDEPIKIDNVLLVPWFKGMIDYIKNNESEYLISHFGLNEATLSSGISIVSDIKLSDLEKYNRVLLGHYHNPQEIKNVIYSGSIIQLDWGEKHEEKRFLDVDSKNDKIDFIPTKGYRKYFSFDLDNQNKDQIIQEANELKSQGHQVTLNKIEEVKDLDETKLKDLRVTDRTERDITNRGINLSMSEDERIRKYLEIQGVEDIDEYVKVGKSIIERAKENI